MVHQHFTSVSPVFHQCFISVLPVFHQFFTSVLTVFQKFFKNVFKVVFQSCWFAWKSSQLPEHKVGLFRGAQSDFLPNFRGAKHLVTRFRWVYTIITLSRGVHLVFSNFFGAVTFLCPKVARFMAPSLWVFLTPSLIKSN